jgi:hypothetical protein
MEYLEYLNFESRNKQYLFNILLLIVLSFPKSFKKEIFTLNILNELFNDYF